MITRKEHRDPAARQTAQENSDTASAYIAEARRQSRGTSELEIDDEPNVSLSKSGAWVAAWVWVDREAAGLELGKQGRAKRIRN